MTVHSLRPGAGPASSRIFLPASFALFLLSLVLAVFFGVVDLPPGDVAATLLGHGSPEAQAIILDIRLPRIATGVLAGIHFALAGFLLQNITRNPLADPSLVGISQGATLSVTLFLLFGAHAYAPGSSAQITEIPLHWLPGIGLLGGLAACVVVYALALQADLGPLRLTLAGIAVGAVLHAVAIGLIAGWGSTRIEVLLEWLSGSLYARTWRHAVFLLPFTIVGLAVLPLIRRPLDLLSLSTPVARSFGLAYRPAFSLVLLLSACLASSAVGVVGPIVFVGLIVPHFACFVAGRHSALRLPLTITLGAVTVTLADLVGRLAGQADEIPIGVVTALCGVPVLIALLRKTP
ncbi:FecCD family ABC transporter permease [Undibacterium oligocarboniphilum]|uniref:Iron ABC transporter permease n=1 Tax=Undibacterium oligocarboniphilum TaxID=666702 RepID=A0A850QEG9_9BURK|nr:iron ABC transporter permease [Undibacterium oligocarboniphilum]MBC3869329.1 iron ABC transporter permease [Undibacterium oligocarboniphilum]NVO77708.1 iron ABC transporter permease [Undibacterium oligocarboniphilum]